jgi:FMN-dependent oxidoreductase (nitrilotriacetate monooxygenase family)
MSESERRFLLGAVTMFNGSHAVHGIWRHPAFDRQRQFERIDHWLELARTLERGCFDLLFLADVIGAYDVYGGDWRASARYGVQFPSYDPLVLLAALAPATKHLGLGLTSSVFYQHPFPFARQISTLDELSGGRLGWNIVTSVIENAAHNMGMERLPDHDERYRWAEEYTQAVYKLWEQSWDDDALVRDADTGVFSDPDGVHEINHVGERWSVRGPHLVAPTPQRTPLLMQAGGSPAGRDFAARHAEAVFLVANTPEVAAPVVADYRRRALAAGRAENDIKLLAALTVVTADTEQAARAKDAELEEWISDEGMLVMLSGHMQTDLGAVDLDRPLADFETDGMQGMLAEIRARVPPEQRTALTYRDLLKGFWRNRIVGSGEQVADRLAEFAAAGVDGVNLVEMVRPEGFEDFIEFVVPVLQQRGMVQREYRDGTLREKIFGRGPRLPPDHPAVRRHPVGV